MDSIVFDFKILKEEAEELAKLQENFKTALGVCHDRRAQLDQLIAQRGAAGEETLAEAELRYLLQSEIAHAGGILRNILLTESHMSDFVNLFQRNCLAFIKPGSDMVKACTARLGLPPGLESPHD